MEILTTGKVLVSARIENYRDSLIAGQGASSPQQVRSMEVPDALVDTGATTLSMPHKLIEQLGLRRRRTCTARTAAGVLSFGVYEPVGQRLIGNPEHGGEQMFDLF
jgi:hypothetical protein